MTLRARLARRLRRIPPAWRVAIAAVAIAGGAVAGVFGYRTYDWVEHDNDFCLSCHLMQEPYERFARSAHRGLGCKACHQPTFAGRSRMALTQIVQAPDSLGVHAEVPNERCTECHVDGDPEKWRLIGASAGHRVHLESDDPELRDLDCVECHSSSVHEFAATDRTCGQAGCHDDVEVRLGKMADLTIHCAACHDFARPVADDAVVTGEGAAPLLRPQREECLSCHAMRVLVSEIPEDEPHDAACGACHNPHEQATPRQAVESCATAGCHARADTLTPMHRGLGEGVLDDCLACHEAHDTRLEDTGCLACHADLFDDAAPGTTAAAQSTATPPGGAASSALFSVHVDRGGAPFRFAQQVSAETFSHARHRRVECASCHDSRRTHGALTVRTVRECQECHHTAPVANRCATCHAPDEMRGTRRVRRTLALSTGEATRTVSFDHARHEGVSCATCHSTPVTLAAAPTCEGCHAEHHEPDAACIACHTKPDEGAHTVASHLTCSGSGCHASLPFRGVPRTRDACLACHQELVGHEPGGSCVDCHRLPPPSGGGG